MSAPSLVLDSEGVSALAQRSSGTPRAQAYLAAALENRAAVVVPSAVLVEALRGGARRAAVERVLGGRGLAVLTTGKRMARLAAGMLDDYGLSSCDAIDALVVATAVRLGGGIVLTSDPVDLTRLAAKHANVRVVGI